MRWIACLVGLALIGCGGKKHDEWWREAGWTEAHTGPAAGEAPRPRRTPAEAEKALAEAVSRADHAEVIRAGAELGERAPAATVIDAVDALAAGDAGPLWRQLPASPARAALALRLALTAEHRGDPGKARGWLAHAAPTFTELADVAAALRGRLDRRAAVDPAVIAVLLPLSGPHAAIGREIEAAVTVAASSAGGARLRFLDTRGEPDGAAAAVDQAAAAGAVAILGPVGDRESQAAAGRAAQLGIPIGLLSPGEGAAPEAGVFRLWPPTDWEAAAAVQAARDLGYDRLAILAPRDEQGSAEIDAFRAAARAAGAEMVAAGQYDPTATDLEPDLEAFLGLDPRSNPRLARHLARFGVKKGWKTFSPDVEFDALYIPDDHDHAALVAAYLPFFNVEVRTGDQMDIDLLRRKHGGRVPRLVQLIGSSGWHHPGLVPRGGATVEGALVIDVFAAGDADASSDGAAAFAAAFTARTGRPPGSLAAEAHDAALLLLRARAAAARAADPRAELIHRLVGARVDDGACTAARVGADGVLTRAALLLRVDGGELVLAD